METKDYDAAMAVVDEALFPTPFRDELRATAQRLSSGGKGILAVRSLTLVSKNIPWHSSHTLSVTLLAPPILTPALPRIHTYVHTHTRTATHTRTHIHTYVHVHAHTHADSQKRLTSPPLP